MIPRLFSYSSTFVCANTLHPNTSLFQNVGSRSKRPYSKQQTRQTLVGIEIELKCFGRRLFSRILFYSSQRKIGIKNKRIEAKPHLPRDAKSIPLTMPNSQRDSQKRVMQTKKRKSGP